MKFKISIYLIILCFGLLNAQSDLNTNTLIVEYSHKMHLEGMPTATNINSVLVSDNTCSLYEMDFVGNASFLEEEDNGENTILNVKPTNNPKIYKERKNQIIFSVERIFMTPFLVKDTFDIFSWNLKSEYKTILGYRCQKAILEYRGRNYVAFFTTNIPFNTGPWKFSGLPGTILEVKSIDGAFEIEAINIKLKKTNVNIKNPYESTLNQKGAISWEEFILKYKKKYEELQSYTDPNGGSMSIPKRKIELLIEN